MTGQKPGTQQPMGQAGMGGSSGAGRKGSTLKNIQREGGDGLQNEGGEQEEIELEGGAYRGS